ncbi:MAG: hypothetical protein HOP04_11870 [Methylophilaceae bacterium]|nr:hypothetical protein [Methylophilaceae bacterium]
MKNTALLLAMLSTPIAAYSGTFTDAMTRCLANSTTGKDRIDLARMMFSVMALHPDLTDIASILPDKRDAIYKSSGLIYNKLMGDVCSKELKVAIQFEGETAAKAGFEFLGKLAMQELMSNPNVTAGFSDAGKYIDTKKILGITKPQ